MKKLIFIAAVMMSAACSNKTNSGTDAADSLSNDTINKAEALATQADGIEAAPADLWTEDAVKLHVHQMYDRLNKMAATGDINLNQMDEEFCTGYFLGVKRNIAKHDENTKGDMRFMGDEGGYRWWVGVGAPLEIVMLEADLIGGNEARARVKFKTDPEHALYEQEQKGHDFMILELWVENGRWRVNNFDAPEAFGKGGLLNMMETYARENEIPLEDNEEPTEGAPV